MSLSSTFTFSFLSPSDCGDVFDAMDNAGHYFEDDSDVWGPFATRAEAEAYAAHVATTL